MIMSLVVVSLKDFSVNLVGKIFNRLLLAVFRYYKTNGLLRFPDSRLMQPYPFGLRIIKNLLLRRSFYYMEDNK